MSAPFTLLGIADLAARWGYTRQGVHQLVGRPGFPTPTAVVNSGRVRVWRLTDVEAFEQERPEFGGEAQRRKQRGLPPSPAQGLPGRP